jgi:NodT family efflux transporter outer membrane factor (OMF) lipoprotein
MPLEQVVQDLNALIENLRQAGAITNDVNTDIQGSAGKLSQIRNALLGDGSLMGLISSSLFTSFVAVYLLMCILFQSWLKPLVIMFTVPLATFGGFLGLFLVHEWSLSDPYMPVQNLDVLTLLGFVILSGVVVNNAILIVAQADVLLKQGEHDRIVAIVKASQSRVRPIFMSLLTSVGGMLPLILNPGAGSELYRGLGAVVVGGMLLSTFFTLVLIPVLLTYIEQVRDVAKLVKPLSISMLLLAMMGCQSFYPSMETKLDSVDLPAVYEGVRKQESIITGWWNQFDDPVIPKLMDRAMKDELSLKTLEKRIESVVALSEQTKAENYPSLNLSSSITREKIPSFQISERTNFTAGLGLSYTLDWLGRVQDEQKIKDSEVVIAIERANAHKLNLVQTILDHYLSYRVAQNNAKLLEDELSFQKDILEIVRQRYKYGKVSLAEVQQAELNLHQLEQQMALVSYQKEFERLTLERWVGAEEGGLKNLLRKTQSLPFLLECEIGTPNDLLNQRSDILIASQQVVAKAAALDISKKEIYPKLTFGAELSFYGESFGNWINSNNSGHSYGPRLSWRLFEFGRLKQERKSAMAAYDEAVLNWRVVVRESLMKVSRLIKQFNQSKQQWQLEKEIQANLQSINSQKQNLWNHGRISQLQAQQAELEALQHQRKLAEVELHKTLVQIDLYKNLGLDLNKKTPAAENPKKKKHQEVLDITLDRD